MVSRVETWIKNPQGLRDLKVFIVVKQLIQSSHVYTTGKQVWNQPPTLCAKGCFWGTAPTWSHSTGDTHQGVERDGGARSPGLVLGPSVTRLMLWVQVGSSPRSRATARGLRPQSAEATAALGLSQQEEHEAGHFGRALRGALWGALGCGPFF